MQINYIIIIPEPPNSPIGWNSTGKFGQKVFKYPFYRYVKRNGKIFARISNLPAKASIKLLIPFMIFKMRKYWLFFRNHLYLMHNNWVVGGVSLQWPRKPSPFPHSLSIHSKCDCNKCDRCNKQTDMVSTSAGKQCERIWRHNRQMDPDFPLPVPE